VILRYNAFFLHSFVICGFSLRFFSFGDFASRFRFVALGLFGVIEITAFSRFLRGFEDRWHFHCWFFISLSIIYGGAVRYGAGFPFNILITELALLHIEDVDELMIYLPMITI